MGKQSADGHLLVKRMRAGQKVAVIENVTIWAESTWKAYADHGDDTHIVTGKEKYVADTINLNDYYLWQGKATDTNNYYSVYALIWKIEITTDNNKKLYLRTKYFTIATQGEQGETGTSLVSVDIVYKASSSDKQEPTGTWMTSPPKLAPGMYLWQAQNVTTQDSRGTQHTETISVQCIASADNLKTAVERYAQTTSRTMPPDNSSSEWKEGLTTGMAAKDGYYIWAQTKITWQDGTITYTTPVCITGDKGETGHPGEDALQYIIECDNETPNITNGAVNVTLTAYTQSGNQQRELAIIDEKKLWWGIKVDGSTVRRLGITNPLTTSINNGTTAELHTQQGIVATKHVTPVKDGQDGQPGVQGLQGCIMRVSEWAPGVEYHNDEALTSGTRYRDIAVVTTGAKTFNAFKCQVTHTSTADNAPVAGNTTTQWQPFNGMAPIYTPLILAENGLIRLAQTNQIIVTDKDSNVTGGMQGDPTLPIIWAGSTTASNGTFRVMADGTMYASKGVFSGTLDGVSGTFESLADKSNKCKIGFQDNGFFFTGYTRFYDSIDVDGDINQQGGGIFYTSNVYCRGVLGSRNRTIAVIDGRQITVYPNGYEQPSNKKTGTLTSATKDGKTVYNIELYSPLTGDGISGMPIDIVIFAPGFSGAELYYQLTGAVGKKVTLLSSKDKAGKIYVAFADGWNLIQQGGIVEAVYIGDLMTPASTKISGIGNGWMHGKMIDNTWA